jgi:hypothetical protein
MSQFENVIDLKVEKYELIEKGKQLPRPKGHGN